MSSSFSSSDDSFTKKLAKTDLSPYAPDDKLLKSVRAAHDKLSKGLKKDEHVSLKPLFDELKSKVSYEDIKLCLVYV